MLRLLLVMESILGNSDMPGQNAGKQTVLQPNTFAVSPAHVHAPGTTQQLIDSETTERFCRVWAEIGQAILSRRSNRS